MLPDSLMSALKELTGQKAGRSSAVDRVTPVGGGCINDCYRVDTPAGPFFAKVNSASRYPGMFESEARGLRLLSVGAIRVPRVLGHASEGGRSLLVLEFLEGGSPASGFWESFGQGLAALHRHSAPRFGLDHDNYIGSLPQRNRQSDEWTEFFVTERLEAQLRLSRDGGRADKELGRAFEGLYAHLGDFFPEESPALLHGDLWSGNFLVARDGRPSIVDPAVYYGHRYMDLGMTLLFGGFSPAFYEAYATAWPLEKNWREGAEIANLYPLLVHLNLFGSGYLGSIWSTLRRFAG
jgi:fructosamine-3-kinase